ncbi:MAG: flagellar biosynthesis protein FlhB [bacterium]|jgi:flagellar biosynthetic protein FlhB
MADTAAGDKTEAATPRKREQAREQGNVPKSQEVNTLMMLIAGVTSFYYFSGDFMEKIGEAIRFYLGQLHRPVFHELDIQPLVFDICWRVLDILAPFFLIFVLTAIISNVSQVGLMFTGKALAPKFSKLNPITGIQRLFEMRGRVELLKAIGKMFLVAPVMIYTVYVFLPELLSLVFMDTKSILIHMGFRSLDIAIRALAILLILAILDYSYQRWQYEQDLKMTKQEVKQETKDIQGDPQIKSRIRSIQMEMSRKRMMEAVPEAEVVVTNPTEYAIAIKYDPEENPAPLIVAKGRNLIARRIKEIARENNIPIVENRPLAQSLYKLVDTGGMIPPDLYQAVAEVLAYVYKLTRKIPRGI